MNDSDVGRILYIGRNPETIEQLTNAPNIELIIKDNGLAAIQWINKNIVEYDKLDAVLCSMGIKGMNVFSLFNHMRFHNLLNKIPFIVIARHFEFASRKLARNHNVDDYFAFPLNLEHLETRVKFLKRYKAEFSETNLKKTLDDFQNHPYKTPFIKRTFDVTMAGGAILALSPVLFLQLLLFD